MKVIQCADDWFMKNWSEMKRIIFMQAYMYHLATGNSLLCRCIKANTMLKYAHAAACFVKAATGNDPRKYERETGNRLADEINKVINEQRRWEKMPNRREPFEVKQWLWLHNKYCTGDYPRHSAEYQAVCWMGAGLLTGFRCGEYAQTEARRVKGKHETIPGTKKPRAFVLSDITFYTENRRTVPLSHVLKDDKKIGRASCTWRVQKNNENGQTKFLSRGKTVDPVWCLREIVCNFIDCMDEETDDIPVGIYKANGKLYYIHDALINCLLQESAIAVFDLDPICDAKNIARWTTHSIRIGACCILFAAGFSPIDIKHILRWKSDTFMMYLRDLDRIMIKHNQAITDASEIPCRL
jgi:hypothetical protein